MEIDDLALAYITKLRWCEKNSNKTKKKNLHFHHRKEKRILIIPPTAAWEAL